VDEAVAWVDAHAAALGSEPVALAEAPGRVLAADIVAPIDVPGFDRSAMDGFAVRGEETIGAGDYNPLAFRVVGDSLPGRPYHGSVRRGEAVRIMTGAAVPAGADAVVPAECARDDGDRVEVTAATPPAKNVGRVGEDVRAGAAVLSARRRLRPQDVGVIASLGLDRVSLVRPPQVRIVITGNELIAPGREKGPHEIYEANSFMLRALVVRDGGDLESVRQVEDRREVIRDALSTAGADVVLVSGGSSVGAEDHAPSLLAELGELALHGIAMRPSSPAGMGRIGAALVFLLPGNPVSCLCAYDFFAGRAIRRLGGRSGEWPYVRVRRTLKRKIVSEIGRVDYCRVRVTASGIEPVALSGAAILSSTTRADGFVIVPGECEGYGPGAEVEAFLYDGPG
jgi:molybdopterin molybdotransferase